MQAGLLSPKVFYTFPNMTKKKFLSLLALGILLISFYRLISDFSSFQPYLNTIKNGVVIPIATGICIAFVINLVSTKFDHLLRKAGLAQRFVRPLAIALGLLSIAAILAIVVAVVVPEFIKAISVLASSLKKFVGEYDVRVEEYLVAHPALRPTATVIRENIAFFLQDMSDWTREQYASLLSDTFSAMVLTIKSVVTFFVSLVFGIYFTAGKERILGHLNKLMETFLRKDTTERILHVGHVADEVFSKYITTQCLEAVILGGLCLAGMLLFRFPYAPMISALTCLSALIPIYGALVSAVIGAFIIGVTSPLSGLFFLIFILILQQVEGNLIYPRVVGSSLGLPSVYVFIAVTASGSVFGLVGMLFAVPVCTVAYRLLREKHSRKTAGKNITAPDGPDGRDVS